MVWEVKEISEALVQMVEQVLSVEREVLVVGDELDEMQMLQDW